MIAVLGLIVVACIANPAAGLRRKASKAPPNTSSALAEQFANCAELENLTVRDVKVGAAASTVCKVWPTQRWGAFPIAGVQRARELFEHALGQGGLYDQMKELAKTRGNSSNFCWRSQTTREFATCDEGLRGKNGKDYNGCQWRSWQAEPCINWQNTDYPWVGDHTFCRNPDGSRSLWCFTKHGAKDCDPIGSERTPFPPTERCFEEDTYYKPTSMRGTSRTTEPTEAWCQKRCALTDGCKHFSYWSMDGGCHLQDGSAKPSGSWLRNPTAGPPSCPQNQSLALAQSFVQLDSSGAESTAISTGCQVFVNGQCYGSCPSGFHPSTLLQFFAPVCSSTCTATKHSFGCGFGCASDAGTCLSTTMDQVTQVASAVGQVVSFVTGNTVVSKVVDKLIQLVEFILTSFWLLVRLGKELWVAYKQSESTSAFISVFVAFVMDNAEQINQNVETLVALFGDVISFWLEMVQEGFKFPSAPISFITDTFNKYGESIMDSAFGVASAFIYPKCDVA